ncbi:MAG: flagellar protein FlgN [Oligoflexia bacterium]|nr:flagellar protein FlgN [Oligoflexia bacterium]
MHEAYKSLEIVLEDEIKVYRALLDLVRREKEVLISAKIDELNENNKSKEAMVLKIRALERVREKAARDLAAAVGASTESPRLLEIASKVVDPYNSKLRSIHSTLDLLIRRIKEINENNEALIQSSLKMVNGALGAIKDTLQPRSTYAQSGEVKKNEVAGHFVSKEV